jgi:hypothetical protein
VNGHLASSPQVEECGEDRDRGVCGYFKVLHEALTYHRSVPVDVSRWYSETQEILCRFLCASKCDVV